MPIFWRNFAFTLLVSLMADTALSASPLRVATSQELYAAVTDARSQDETVIELEDGVYSLPKPLRIAADRVTLRSRSENPEKVVLVGNGMRQTGGVDNLVEVSGKHVSLIGLTLQEAGNHLIQLRGESDADHFRLLSCVLRDSYEQLMKVSGHADGKSSADFGIVQNTRFEYTEDLGPNFYIGGIDMHGGKNWLIAQNYFRNIASPADKTAEFAIHLWTHSADNLVRDNVIINSDRGIGFGLTDQWFRHNQGGEITGNIILHLRPSDPFADVGIALESSPGTLVSGNFIYLTHSYPNAIEYRFSGTRGAIISGNITNKAITARDGAEALVEGNQTASMANTAIDYAALTFRKLRERFASPD
jgi:hypothetical protein